MSGLFTKKVISLQPRVGNICLIHQLKALTNLSNDVT